MYKRMISMLLTFALCFGMVPMTAMATELPVILEEEPVETVEVPAVITELEETVPMETQVITDSAAMASSGQCGNNLYWSLNNTTLTISGTGTMWDYDSGTAPWSSQVIYSVIVDYGVTSLGESAFQGSTIKSIELPNTLTQLGKYCFQNCDNLTNIILPGSINSISWQCFYGCSNLKNVVISEGTTSMSKYCFQYCDNLTTVILPSTLKKIGESAFYDCKKLNTITLPDGLTTIETWGFNGTGLTSITIPKSVTTLEEGAFARCSDLTNITFAGDAPIINENAFRSVTATVYYPEDNTTWTSDVMQDYGGALTWEATTIVPGGQCGDNLTWSLDETGLLTISGTGAMWDYGTGYFDDDIIPPWNPADIKTVAVNSGVTHLGDYAFYNCSDLSSITLPNSLNSLGNACFSFCDTLNNVTLPSKLTTIGDYCFSQCIGMTKITIPSSVTSLGGACFYDCTSLNSVNLSSGLTELPYMGFEECSNLSSITIPRTITTIYEYCFSDCSSLKKIVFQGNAPAFEGSNIFENVTATAQYPTSNSTWTSTVRQDYGGDITWKATGQAAAAITSHPSNVTVNAGAKATFKVTASGTGLTYQWQYRTSSTGNWVNATATGNKTATLTVPGTAGRNGYYYRCKVTDSNGNVVYSNAAKLTVNATAASITQHPSWAYVDAGEKAIFKVKATGTSLKYQWQYRTSSTGTWMNATATGNKTASLTVPGTAGRNGYYYRCRVKDAAGNTVYSNAAKLTVNVTAASITSHPSWAYVEAGEKAIFKVKATGTGLKYQWQYRTSSTGSWMNATATGNKTAILTVPGTAGRNGYYYRCRVKDAAGNTVYSDAARLTVQGATLAITQHPEAVDADEGTYAVFKVKATGTGLKYQWQYRAYNETAWKNATAAGSKTATLTVPATWSRDLNEYRCKVTDAAGNVVYSNCARLWVW